MPRRRCGTGWTGATGQGAACPRRIARFLEPCLLLLLRQDANHGYNLLEALDGFGFARDSVDASVVYRVLREMEQAGWVVSQWEITGSGPSRRVYQLTHDGEEYLHWWIEDLQRTRDEIDNLIAVYAGQPHGDAGQNSTGDGSEGQNVPD